MIFYGINPILESLRSPCIPEKIYIEPGKNNPGIQRIRKQASYHSIPIEEKKHLDVVCSTRDHQGVCGVFRNKITKHFPDDFSHQERVVLLDNIQDPRNFGAAIRVCDVFGFRDVIFHKGNSSGITPAAMKASTGAIFHVNLYISNLNNAVRFLQNENYTLYALDNQGDTLLQETTFSFPCCLVIGAEHTGVRYSIKKKAEKNIKIPWFGKIQSLNLSCALAVALYELRR